MAGNHRIFYAVQEVGVAKDGFNTFTAIHGLQSVGINTKFNLEAVFEVGQIGLYENIENIPDVELTLEKVLDGYAPIYTLVTYPSTTPTLSGRSATRCIVGLSIFSDVQDSASGTPLAQCTVSGVYVSALSYDMTVQGPFKESVTLVADNKVWNNTFTATAFTNADNPLAIAGSGGVAMRQNFLLGEGTGNISVLPTEIPGVTSSGTVPFDTVNDIMAVHIQSVKISTSLGREPLYELGRRGMYFRYAQFPTQVKTDIETIPTIGDQVSAYNDANSTTDQHIRIYVQEGTVIDTGTKNRLESVTYGGANAGQNGGNATATYSYVTWNNCTVTHPQDPSGLTQ